jgi:hypothetical protein
MEIMFGANRFNRIFIAFSVERNSGMDRGPGRSDRIGRRCRSTELSSRGIASQALGAAPLDAS